MKLPVYPSRFLRVFLLFVFLVISFSLALPSSVAFTNTADKTNYMGYYIPKKKIKKIFNKRTIHRQVIIELKVPTAFLSEIFTNLEKVIFLANKYGKQKYEIKSIENEIEKNFPCFWTFDGDKAHACVYPLLEDNRNPEDAHFVYYGTGGYTGAVKIKGLFILDMRILRRGAVTIVDIKSYFQLANPFFSYLTYVLRRENEKFNTKLEKIIDESIEDMVAAGEKTAYGYYANLSPKNPPASNSPPSDKAVIKRVPDP